ncbi:hypothetical protein BMETH_88_1 [methanotrophic bacterial endosymbiont of Bathymodiolus sp.]|nr:hypothetical protein BMETH_88_1 [methanotrophic bacterial endosymbiont of Bathymodiolus sp.]
MVKGNAAFFEKKRKGFVSICFHAIPILGGGVYKIYF